MDVIHTKSPRKPADWHIVVMLLALAAAAAFIAGVYVWRQGGGEDQPAIRVITGVQFPYPAGWAEQPLSADDKKAGLVLRVERENPAASFLARTVVAPVVPELDVSKLASDTEAALKGQIEGFQSLSKEVVTIGGYQAAEITYRQANGKPSDDFTVRMTIIPTTNQTFYLTLRSPTDQFTGVNTDGHKMAEDFATYVRAAPR
jgi:hypothetical protein